MTDSAVSRGWVLTAVAVLALSGCEGRDGQPHGRETPSGLPVPRYVSLKFAEVNARGGPGDDYKLLWVYRAKGLPLQVIAETQDWRKVCDPTGGAAWVKATGIDGRRTVIRLKAEPLSLLDKPMVGGKTTAILPSRAVALVDRCDKGWCRLRGKGSGGWTMVTEVWGADEQPQCR